MTKEEYAGTLIRVCSNHGCDTCEIQDTCYLTNYSSPEDFLELLGALEKWAEEHPIKTNRDKFEEVFGIGIVKGNEFGDCENKTLEECLACMKRESIVCEDCPWWDAEYIEPKENEND